MKHIPPKILHFVQHNKSQCLFAGALLVVLGINLIQLTADIQGIKNKKAKLVLNFLGIQFAGLEEVLKDVEHIGYYTDKNMENTRNAAQFAQAQYTLAPIIVDLNNTDHEFILFDCTDEPRALRKIKEINAVPLKKNQYGIILAQKISKRR